MAGTPKQVVAALLKDTTNEEALSESCARDVTYLSLNYSNPDLKKVMPWCGTQKGVRAIERRDGMSEMNWPDGPDPFHYREHRNG